MRQANLLTVGILLAGICLLVPIAVLATPPNPREITSGLQYAEKSTGVTDGINYVGGSITNTSYAYYEFDMSEGWPSTFIYRARATGGTFSGGDINGGFVALYQRVRTIDAGGNPYFFLERIYHTCATAAGDGQWHTVPCTIDAWSTWGSSSSYTLAVRLSYVAGEPLIPSNSDLECFQFNYTVPWNQWTCGGVASTPTPTANPLTPTPTRTPVNTPTRTPSPTATPYPFVATSTPFPISTPTLTPTPTGSPQPTSTPFSLVADPNFTRSDQSAWSRQGDVSWSFSRITLGAGSCITQRIGYISSQEQLSVTLRASAETTGTVLISVGGQAATFQVTRRVAQTFRAPMTVQFPADVIICNQDDPDVTVSFVSMSREGLATTQDAGIPPGSNGPSPIGVGDFFDYFLPWDRTRSTGISGTSFPVTMAGLGAFVGRTMASVIEIAYVRMFQMYLGLRIVMIGIAFVINFVTSRLRLNDPGVSEGESVVINNYGNKPESVYERRARTKQRTQDFLVQRGRVRVRGYTRNPPRF